ncbi:MAG: NAD(+) diphosphatase [Victivallales bacterium]|nr:NAD(+) diphosphatase [Victivallales bacterium]
MFTISQVNKELPVSELSGQERVVLFNRQDVLLATVDGVNRLPRAEEVPGLLPADGMLMAVGTIDGAICCGTSVKLEEMAIPSGLSVMPTRIAFAESGPDIMNAVSRVREMTTWRRQHRLCGGCGAPLSFSDTDLALVCPQCGERYYPQIAPAVIVAITRNERKELLLAHNKRFTGNVFSLIAGFVEAGETVEQAVQREIMEETGVTVKNIRYLSSQPWPFPNSLMLAFEAEWESGEAMPDGEELAELGWFTKETLPTIPSPGSIANRVISRFFNL